MDAHPVHDRRRPARQQIDVEPERTSARVLDLLGGRQQVDQDSGQAGCLQLTGDIPVARAVAAAAAAVDEHHDALGGRRHDDVRLQLDPGNRHASGTALIVAPPTGSR